MVLYETKRVKSDRGTIVMLNRVVKRQETRNRLHGSVGSNTTIGIKIFG